MIKFFLVYFIAINIIAFVVYGIDKRRAVKHRWRIPESTLLLFAAAGGAVGALAGMHIFHHKTKKMKFAAGVPAILALEAAVLMAFLFIGM